MQYSAYMKQTYLQSIKEHVLQVHTVFTKWSLYELYKYRAMITHFTRRSTFHNPNPKPAPDHQSIGFTISHLLETNPVSLVISWYLVYWKIWLNLLCLLVILFFWTSIYSRALGWILYNYEVIKHVWMQGIKIGSLDSLWINHDPESNYWSWTKVSLSSDCASDEELQFVLLCAVFSYIWAIALMLASTPLWVGLKSTHTFRKWCCFIQGF